MKKLIEANQLEGEDGVQSDQSTVYESIRTTRINAKRSLNYIFYKDDNVSSEIDVADRMIDKYLDLLNSSIINKDALSFWKQHSNTFPFFASLAKKYLSVQASSAAVERMFSISGNIFSQRRRRMTTDFFTSLVFLKLNEKLL
jgi:hypothetical protein